VRNPILDRFVRGFILLGSTVPGFWLALLLILFFSVNLGWFPVSGAGGWKSLVLPVLTIGFGGVALVARVKRWRCWTRGARIS
jgi:ABC-type dipeptide/oligopeptide/nickel transport system permease component